MHDSDAIKLRMGTPQRLLPLETMVLVPLTKSAICHVRPSWASFHQSRVSQNFLQLMSDEQRSTQWLAEISSPRLSLGQMQVPVTKYCQHGTPCITRAHNLHKSTWIERRIIDLTLLGIAAALPKRPSDPNKVSAKQNRAIRIAV